MKDFVGSTKNSEIEILPINEPINEKLYDYQIPIGSLGQYFRKSIDDFRSPYPY